MSRTARTDLLVVLVGALLVTACAGQPHPRTAPAPILPAKSPKPAAAPPSARDALEAGLRWILADAPETAVGPAAHTPPAVAPAGAPP